MMLVLHGKTLQADHDDDDEATIADVEVSLSVLVAAVAKEAIAPAVARCS